MRTQQTGLHLLLGLIFCALALPRCIAAATPQTIAWSGTTDEILTMNKAYPIGAKASSGLPVHIRVAAGPAALNPDGTITAAALGTVTVIADQPGDGAYAPVTLIRRFNVRQVTLSRLSRFAMSGAVLKTHVIGNLAYVSMQGGLQILDVSDPSIPKPIGRFESSKGTSDVKVVGNRAYLADNDGGLRIVEVSDPAHPVELGRFQTVGPALSLDIAGNLAYVAEKYNGWQIIDIADPGHPARIGELAEVVAFALGVQVVGNLAYVTDPRASLQIADVSVPSAPRVIGRIPEQALNAQVVGNLAFVGTPQRLMIYDVTNPTSPARIATHWTEPGSLVTGVQIVGNLAFISVPYAYGTTPSVAQLRVIDVSDPANPFSVGEFVTENPDVQGFEVVGDRVFVSNSDSGLQILKFSVAYPNAFDFSPQDALVTDGFIELQATSGNGAPVIYTVVTGAASIEGNRLVFSQPGQVVLRAEQSGGEGYLPINREWTINIVKAPQGIDWTGAADFIPLNQPLPLAAASTSGLPLTLRVESGPALIADGKITVNGAGTVWVTAEQAGDASYLPVSKSRPFNLRQAAVSLMGQYSDSAAILDFAMNGNFLYAASGEKGLQIFDVTDPALPKLVGQYRAPADSRTIEAVKISVVGNIAYLGNRIGSADSWQVSGSIDILDVTDPAKPALMGSILTDTDFPLLALQAAGNLAYALLEGYLLTIDVSNPAAPTIVNQLDLHPDFYTSFQQVGPLMYLAGYGLTILDISTPTKPREIARYDPNQIGIDGLPPVQLRVAGPWVYLLTGGDLITVQGDPTNLVVLGTIKVDSYATAFDVWGDYILVSERMSGVFGLPYPGGVEVFDASNPARLVSVGGYRTFGSAFQVRTFGEIAYLGGDGSAPLKVLKTTLHEPSEPRLDISRPTADISILSAPSISGWEVDFTFSLAPDQLQWWSFHGFLYEESDGIKRFRVGGGDNFFRMRKEGF